MVQLDGREPAQPVRIIDIDMPMRSMVQFMVKWAIAAIPAFIILFLLALFAAAFVTSLGL